MTSLSDFQWGIERESHRLAPDGSLSQAPHPDTLGAPAFTRDFAESQVEIVTRPHATFQESLAELERLTDEARQAIDPEWLWPLSMPPRIPSDEEITIARFGPGDEARRATLYRQGLARRYGTARQMICGVHVNVSAGTELMELAVRQSPLTPEELMEDGLRNALYLRLARNLYADLPFMVLLTGASPFRVGGERTTGRPAVSHRNSPSGYARQEYKPYLDLSSLDAYLNGIRRGLRTVSSAIAGLGLVRDGRVVQLNANIFQTDKEFYAPIRLRQSLNTGESTLDALDRRGIGYLELRFLDVDPFHPAGITESTLRLMHLTMLDGLYRRSHAGVGRTLGRDLDLFETVALLNPFDLSDQPIVSAARKRLNSLRGWARRLDDTLGGDSYADCIAGFRHLLENPDELPSARIGRAADLDVTDWREFGFTPALQPTTLLQGTTDEVEYAWV